MLAQTFYSQALSGAAERNEDIILVCYDNEAYMNNGIQRSSATPASCWTITAPASALKLREKKDMAAHGVPYTATASIANPDDLIAKPGKAKTIRGAKFINHYASCPTGWRLGPMPPKDSVDVNLKIQGGFKAMGLEAEAEFQRNVERD